MSTECEAERVIKQAIYKLDLDWGDKKVDVAGVLAILRRQSEDHCQPAQ
jgi:DNA polymerase III delta subunit